MVEPTSMVTEAVIKEILHHISIAYRCRKELESLRSLLSTLQGFNSDLQKRGVGARSDPSVKKWLRELDMLLRQAKHIVQDCSIPTCNFFARYTMSKKFTCIIQKIEKHKSDAAIVHFVHSFSQPSKGHRPGSSAQGSRNPNKGDKSGSSAQGSRNPNKGDKSGKSGRNGTKGSRGNKSGSSANANKKDKMYKFIWSFSFGPSA